MIFYSTVKNLLNNAYSRNFMHTCMRKSMNSLFEFLQYLSYISTTTPFCDIIGLKIQGGGVFGSSKGLRAG